MGKFTFVEEVVKEVKAPYAVLTPGEYEGVIAEARETTIRNGRHAGKRSVDVAVKLVVDGRYIWKVLPLFTPAEVKKLSEADRNWYKMSTVSFVIAYGIEKDVEIGTLVGKDVKVVVGMHQDNGYGPQNSIVRFLKK